MPTENTVALIDSGCTAYPVRAPFHPPEIYPEYPFSNRDLDPDNRVYPAVREMLQRLGYDRANFGKPQWSPLRHLISPGSRVVIKPNLVISEHELGPAGIDASVAHGSIIRAITDYALIACGQGGLVSIVDSPIKEVDFDRITEHIGLAEVVSHYRMAAPAPVELLDLRDLHVTRNPHGVMVADSPLLGDPRGYVVVDLAGDSAFADIAHLCHLYRSTAAVYHNAVPAAHDASRHRYSIARTVLDADVVISIAKLKTHRKAGVTLSLKNAVGTTNEKRWLPHHRYGPPSCGGDQYADQASLVRRIREGLADSFVNHRWGKLAFQTAWPAMRALLRLARRCGIVPRESRPSSFSEGDWWGNDTIWRTVLDLNVALRYANVQGVILPERQRQFFCCIDGIVAGEGEGPLHPRPRATGLIFGGENPVAVDMVCAHAMGYDFRRIPTIANAAARSSALDIGRVNPAAVLISSNVPLCDCLAGSGFPNLQLEPTAGWKNAIER